MNKISDYESIKTFWSRLSRQEPGTQIYTSTKQFEFGLVTFDGTSKQTHKFSKEPVDNWNCLNLFNATEPTSVELVCEMLKPFAVNPDHTAKPILLQYSLIAPPKCGVYKFNCVRGLDFNRTDMNPYLKFATEFENVFKTLKDEQDLILSWLRKKIPSGVEVYVVGKDMFLGSHALSCKYSRVDRVENFKALFKPDELCSSLYISKLSTDKFNLMFGEFSVDDVLKTFNAL